MKEMMFGVFLLFLVILAWGLAGIFGKIALKSINSTNCYFLEAIGALTVCLIFLIAMLIKQRSGLLENLEFNGWALLFGILYGIGTLLFIFVLSTGRAAIIVPLTALYPLITVILALLWLGETLNLPQGIGVVLAVVAGVLLAWPS